jgi:hypothetical protein
MTETKRIRWEPTVEGDSLIGYVGTLEPDIFLIWHANAGPGEWRLTSHLPGQHEYHLYRDVAGILKAEAERWLEEFAASLGAMFPDALRAEVEDHRDTHYDLAGDHGELGHVEQAERAYGRVEALDWMLAAIDRILPPAPETAAVQAGEEQR